MKLELHLEMVFEAVDFIEANLQEPIGVSQVCALNTMSPWQFQRVFRSVVGDSIGNYIRGRRLTQAAQLLQKKTELRVLDVAVEFQFNSQEAFARAFKENFGITPAEYRKNTGLRLPHAKPRLDKDKIVHIQGGVQKEPEIRTFHGKNFIGLPVQIDSPLGIETNFDGKMPAHWAEFDRRRREIPFQVPGCSYGFALSPGQYMQEETLTYLAGVEVDDVPTNPAAVPKGMQRLELQTMQVAVFEVTGFISSCHVTTDFIYGIWLPQSDFIRAPGPDFEFFDHKIYQRNNPQSVSYYFLPVVAK